MSRRLPALLGLLLLALVAAACGDDEQDREASAQSQSINVKLRKDIGPTEVIDKELQSGAFDAYPESLGVAVTVAAGRDDAGGTAEETYALAKEFYAGRGQAISEQTAFENVDAIATTQYFAQRRGLATVGDLRALPRFTLGARPEFNERLTTSAMIQMNRDVELDRQDPAIVAERFLRTAGLLGGG